MIIKDNLDENRRGIDKDMETRMENKLASSFAKYSASVESMINQQSTADTAKLWDQFKEAMKRMEKKNEDSLNDTVK